ncbi:MAG: hypothetical protein NTW80_08475, partial [Deltaproteobacteria bacterium]|nr:hypothetical protein [Deltaproteobacteria bacterium]
HVRCFFRNRSTLFNVLSYIYHTNPLIKSIGLASYDQQEQYTLTFERHYSLPSIISTVQRAKEIAQGFDAIFLIIPSRFLWVPKNHEVEDRIHRDFISQMQKEHLSVVDPRPYFEKIGNPLDAFFKHDGHWNETGHRLVAQAIAEHIKQHP